MDRKFNKWILLVLILQLIALMSVAGKREWIRSFGDIVYLRTAPVDPRDIFRGDYVRLAYEIAVPERKMIPKQLGSNLQEQVFLKFNKDARGIAHLEEIVHELPKGSFIRAKLFSQNRQNENGVRSLKLGIEKYFLEQGSGLALEDKRGRGQEWQTPLEVEVALGSDGTAVLRGHRWSEVGIRLNVVEVVGDNNDENQRISPKISISFRNQSEVAMSILDTENHCSFKLVENQFNQLGLPGTYFYRDLPNRDCENYTWTIHHLLPGQIYQFEIDFAETDWYLNVDGKVQEIGNFSTSWAGFRWIYRPPQHIVANFTKEENLWTSAIWTTRFNARGRID